MVEIIHSQGAVSLGALAAQTSQEVTADYGAELDRSFLMTKAKLRVTVGDMSNAERIFVVLCDDDMTDAQIIAALGTRRDSGDAVRKAEDQKLKGVIGPFHGGASENPQSEEFTFGKGVPFEEGNGWAVKAFNPAGGALTTGIDVFTYLKVTGVWL